MTTQVQIDSANGTARITPSTPLPVGQALRFALFDVRAKRYLTASGWGKSRKTLAEITPAVENEGFVIDAAVAALIPPGSSLLLEEVSLNLREQFAWPARAQPAPPPPAPIPAIETREAQAAPEDTLPPSPSTSPEIQKPTRRGRAWLALVVGMALGGAAGVGLALILLPPARPSPELIAREKAVNTREANAAATEARLATERADIDTKTTAFEASLRKAQSSSQSDAVQLAAVRSERDVLQATLAKLQKDFSVQADQLKAQIAENRELQAAGSETAKNSPAGAAAAEPAATADVAALNATIGDLRAQVQAGSLQLQTSRTEIERLAGQVDGLTRDKKALTDNLAGRDSLVANWAIEREAHLAQIQTLQAQLKTTAEQMASAKPVALAGTPSADRANWGAASMSSNGSVDTIVNQTSAEFAKSVALKLCASRKGSCSLITTFQNSCFAMARAKGDGVRPDNWREGVNPSWQEAEAIAMDRCEQETGMACKVVLNTCTPDELSKPD